MSNQYRFLHWEFLKILCRMNRDSSTTSSFPGHLQRKVKTFILLTAIETEFPVIKLPSTVSVGHRQLVNILPLKVSTPCMYLYLV